MSSERVYTPEDLAIFDALGSPVWIVDLVKGHQLWANLACVPMWGEPSREVLLARSAAHTGMSETSRLRLAALRRKFERGERTRDRWTFYPDNAPPLVVDCQGRGIQFAPAAGEPSKLVMLVEGRILDESEAGANDRRLVEALRYLGEVVTLYSEAGAALMRNPAAARVLGDPREGDQFTASFVDAAQAAEVRAHLMAHPQWRADVRVATVDGERWYDTAARRTLDPVTGATAILVTQTDVSERRAHLAEIERSRLQISEQAAELRQLSSPVISVGKGILALPLIGDLDRERLELAMTALLTRAAQGRIRRVVLDLTGVAAVDASAGAGLLRITRALRLQGIASTLSGLRPQLAQAIVAAGIDLSEVPCTQTIEHALAEAERGR